MHMKGVFTPLTRNLLYVVTYAEYTFCRLTKFPLINFIAIIIYNIQISHTLE